MLSGFDLELLGSTLTIFERHAICGTYHAHPTSEFATNTRFEHSELANDLLRRGPMYVADLERALGIFGPRLYQIYGQGESPMTITGLSHGLHVAPGDVPSVADRLASCGTARSGVTVKVFDDDDRELPAGEIGEVVTRSDCMMLGYWNNPEQCRAAKWMAAYR